ncbi:MAG: hypothetical protein JW953_24155 [Anaerolineae bacterium]|nr:hypothetical protein [Anaerolineae bacterium]
MEFERLLQIVGNEPVFETGLLLAGEVNPTHIRRQLSRWTKAGRIYQLRRGLYALAPPFQKIKPHPYLVANRMVRGSYVSLQTALAHYNLIPEYVPVVISVTTRRPMRWDTPLGSFEFRHIKTDLLYSYRALEVGEGQQAFVATPEKAILDLVYFQPGGDSRHYLRELRLQHLDQLNLEELRRQARLANSAKLRRAATTLADLARTEMQEYETL